MTPRAAPPAGRGPTVRPAGRSEDRFRQRYGPWAVVTGASSGLGAEFARQLGARGLNLVLVARRLDRLEALAAEIAGRHGCDIRPVECDLRRSDFWSVLGPRLSNLDLGLLVHSAGFANTGEVVVQPLSRELDLLSVNCRAALVLAHAVGNRLRARGHGGIVFVSSTMAFTPVALWANYCASKAYELNLAEGMYQELRPEGVDVLAVCPGPVATDFYQAAGSDLSKMPRALRFLLVEPSKVVAAALRGLGRRRSVVPGWGNRLMAGLGRVVPRSFLSRRVGAFVAAIRREPAGVGDSGDPSPGAAHS